MSPVRSAQVMAGIFGVSGVLHLVKPTLYEQIMPSWVPAHREVIIGSGVAELALAAGLLAPQTRSASGWGSIALLLGVYPANVQMAIDAASSSHTGYKAAAFGRLPFQLPMLKLAYDAARG